jgi:hypothetical protein
LQWAAFGKRNDYIHADENDSSDVGDVGETILLTERNVFLLVILSAVSGDGRSAQYADSCSLSYELYRSG